MTSAALILVAASGVEVSARQTNRDRNAPSTFVIEWADHPANGQFGNSVFQRTLFCWTNGAQGAQPVCQLTVIAIGRGFCPAVLTASVFHTDTDDLIVRLQPNAIDLEFIEGLATWTIHLKVSSGNTPIVEEASGVFITKPLLPSDRIRSVELVALVVGHEGFEGIREFAEVDLKCNKVAVVAAKRAPK